MGKCWIFEETGEVRVPQRGEWINKPLEGNFSPHKNYALTKHYPILKFTKYKSNPLEPILRTWQVWGKNWLIAATKDVSLTDTEVLLRHALLDIQESVGRMEAKED